MDEPASAVYDTNVPNVLQPGAISVKNVSGVDFRFPNIIMLTMRSASIIRQ